MMHSARLKAVVAKMSLPTVVVEYVARLTEAQDDRAKFDAILKEVRRDDSLTSGDLAKIVAQYGAFGLENLPVDELFDECEHLFKIGSGSKGDDQPRVPAGGPDGGQFAPSGGGGSGGGGGSDTGRAPFEPGIPRPATGIALVDHHVGQLTAAGNSREKFDAAVSALKADKSVDKAALTKISQTYGNHVWPRLSKERLHEEITRAYIRNARFLNKIRSNVFALHLAEAIASAEIVDLTGEDDEMGTGTKDFALKVKATDEAGSIEGYASVFGVRDSANEIVMPGAFSDSLARQQREGSYPLMLWQHNTQEPIGVWDDLSDDGKGLFARGRLLVDQNVPEADKAYALLKAGAVRGMSIGYREIDVEPASNTEARKLLKLDLLECSIVSFPANRRALVESVKSDADVKAIKFWKRFEDLARKFRDGEPLPAKEYEEILREAGFPKSVAVQIASVGYVKSIRSESGGDEATSEALARLKAALKGFSPKS